MAAPKQAPLIPKRGKGRKLKSVERDLDLEEFAESLPKKYLECRELTHQWAQWDLRRAKGGSEAALMRILRCRRCHHERHQEISAQGAILSDRPRYPEGYLRKGMGRITGSGRDTLRMVALLRSEIKDWED